MNTPVTAPIASNVGALENVEINLISKVYASLGLEPVSEKMQESLEAIAYSKIVHPACYVILFSPKHHFFVMCPIVEQEGIVKIPNTYDKSQPESDYIVCEREYYDALTQQTGLLGLSFETDASLKRRYRTWSKLNLKPFRKNVDSYYACGNDRVNNPANNPKVLAVKDGAYTAISFDFYSYYSSKAYDLFMQHKSFIFVPEYADGSAIGLIRNYQNAIKHEVENNVVPIYIPMKNVIGFGELAVHENIYTLSLANLKKLESTFTANSKAAASNCYGIYPGDYSLVDLLPSLFRNNNGQTLDPYHSIEARRLELDRVAGSNAAKEIGFSVAKFLVVEKGYLKNTTHSEFLEYAKLHLSKTHVAVKRLADSFLTILDFAEPDSYEVLKSYNETLDLFLQDYISDQDHELNLMFLIANGNVHPVGVSCETNKLLPNNSGGKVGNSSTFHWVNPSKRSVVGKLLEKFTKKIAHWLNTSKNAPYFYGWVDVTLLALDEDIDHADTENYYFVEWMVRNAVDNFSVLTSNMASNYTDVLHTLATTGTTNIKWVNDHQFIVGYNMFQVNFVTPNSVSFIDVPKNFVPVDSGVGVYLTNSDASITGMKMPINQQDLARIGNFNTSIESPLNFMALNKFESDSQDALGSVPSLAYRGNLTEDWSNSLVFYLVTKV